MKRQIRLNFDSTCVLCWEAQTLNLYRLKDLALLLAVEFPEELKHVALLRSSNLVAIVTQDNSVEIWEIGEMQRLYRVCYQEPIVGLEFSCNKVYIIFTHSFLEVPLSNTKDVRQYETSPNPRGLLHADEAGSISYIEKGRVVRDYTESVDGYSYEIKPQGKTISLFACEQEKVAICNERGTIINLYEEGQRVCCFRRGYQKAVISSIAFHQDWVAVASRTGTVHLFSRLSRSQLFDISKTFPVDLKTSSYSFGQFRIRPDIDSRLTFIEDKLVIITTRHIYYISLDNIEPGVLYPSNKVSLHVQQTKNSRGTLEQ